MPREIPKFIESRFGSMFIIEHHPDGPTPDTWVISCNSGLQNRSGPRRLYAYFARRLVDFGVGVVRIDLPGVGDSDGPIPATHFDCYDPADVATAIAYVRDRFDAPKIILHGLCAGSRVAIKAAAQDPAVIGVLAWSTTIFTATPGSTPPPEDPRHSVTNAAAAYNTQRAKRFFRELRFLRSRFWRDFFTSGDSLADLRSVFWSALHLLKGGDREQLKTHFINALHTYIESGRPIHFTYGNRDQPCFSEFLDLRLELPEDRLLVVKDGTHTFSTASQRETAIEGTVSWVCQEFLESNIDEMPAATGTGH